MEPIKFFDKMELLEPRCSHCNTKLNYGVSTRYSEKEGTHVCLSCGVVLR